MKLSNFKGSRWFDDSYRNLLLSSVLGQFSNLKIMDGLISEDFKLKSLLEVASALSSEKHPESEDISYRIAQFALQFGDELEQVAACVVLDKMANRQSIRLVKDQDAIESIRSELPIPMKWDWIRRDMRFKEILLDQTEIELNRFQLDLWETLQGETWLSASAPTSCGKSFIITKWLHEFVNSRHASLTVFIVPTRALIKQTVITLKSEFKGNENINISSVPSLVQTKRSQHNILVFTQERLQILQSLAEISIDLLIVDEAQKISDLDRGILLHQVIEQTSSSNQNVSAIFLSPLTENPEELLTAMGRGNEGAIDSNHVVVNQNLIWVSPIKHKPLEWGVELCINGEPVSVGKIDLQHRPNSNLKKLAFVSKALSTEGEGSIVYVNGAADAEKVSVLLAELTDDPEEVHPRIIELQKLIKKVIHKNYVLLAVLVKGIGFHYGNIPLLIKEEIEELFKEGILKFLVCTSTLVEGVNLPCRSIFLMGPKKGRGTHMKPEDFWNLAGRAGRLGHEFQGNIFCIDPRNERVWNGEAPKSRRKFKITSSVKEVALEHEQFIEYLKNESPRETKGSQRYDSLLSFLMSYKSSHGTVKTSPALEFVNESISLEIDTEIDRCIKRSEIPWGVINKNPGISPYAMMRLFEYFKNYEKDIDNLIPLFPEEEDALSSYIAVLSRINKYLNNAFFTKLHGILIVNWMRGYSLNRLIQDRIKHFSEFKSEAALIRDTMDDVEKIARFRGPKYIGCYTDVLNHFLETKGIEQKVDDVRLWLEFGASNLTQISLMSLGLSRTAAVELSGIIPQDDMNEDSVQQWISLNNVDQLGLPDLVVNDIKNVFS